MDKLKAYLNGLSVELRGPFCARCGTTEGYLRKVFSTGGRLGESLCINIERETGSQVKCEDMRPDVDWAFIRGSRAA